MPVDFGTSVLCWGSFTAVSHIQQFKVHVTPPYLCCSQYGPHAEMLCIALLTRPSLNRSWHCCPRNNQQSPETFTNALWLPHASKSMQVKGEGQVRDGVPVSEAFLRCNTWTHCSLYHLWVDKPCIQGPLSLSVTPASSWSAFSTILAKTVCKHGNR